MELVIYCITDFAYTMVPFCHSLTQFSMVPLYHSSRKIMLIFKTTQLGPSVAIYFQTTQLRFCLGYLWSETRVTTAVRWYQLPASQQSTQLWYDRYNWVTEGFTQRAQELQFLDVVTHCVTKPHRASPLLGNYGIVKPRKQDWLLWANMWLFNNKSIYILLYNKSGCGSLTPVENPTTLIPFSVKPYYKA